MSTGNRMGFPTVQFSASFLFILHFLLLTNDPRPDVNFTDLLLTSISTSPLHPLPVCFLFCPSYPLISCFIYLTVGNLPFSPSAFPNWSDWGFNSRTFVLSSATEHHPLLHAKFDGQPWFSINYFDSLHSSSPFPVFFHNFFAGSTWNGVLFESVSPPPPFFLIRS